MSKVQIWGVRANRGKSRLFSEINRYRQQGQRVLLLVPEQYTLQAERELIHSLDLPGLMNIDVLSPTRLGRRIQEAAGRQPLAPLNESGRRMALAQALSQCQEELQYYGRVALSAGLPEKLSALLTDFQRAALRPEDLAQHAQTLASGAQSAKEHDLALLFSAYEALIAGRFTDETTQQFDLVDRLSASGIMKDAAVFVWQFDMLSTPFAALLAAGARECAAMRILFTMDTKQAEDERVFLSQRRSAADLCERMRHVGVPVDWLYLDDDFDTPHAPALQHLEKHLFTRKLVDFAGDMTPVQVHAAANPYAEAAYAAQVLQNWHRAGIPWQRMAVTLADTDHLPGILAVTLQSAGIPCYQARKDSAVRHGLSRMLLGALRCISASFVREDVLQMAKSGFSPLTMAEADLLENYAIVHGVARGKWLQPFTWGADAEEIEPLRQRLMEPVLHLRDALRRAATAAASVEAIFRFLEEVGAYERLMQREEALLSRSMAAEATQSRQVWRILMALLDQLYALLGEQKANLKELSRFVEAGLTGATISSLPPEPDTVMIGEAGHLMTGQLDALLVMGMQDGAMTSSSDSLLTESEQRTLCDATHRAIGLTRQETAALRMCDFYRTFALPSQALTITFSQSGQDGSALRPAGIVEDLKNIFPAMVFSGGVTADTSLPLSPALALSGLPAQLRRALETNQPLPEAWADALRWLWRDPSWHSRAEGVLRALNAHGQSQFLPQAYTRRLFTQDKVSISRLEGFAQCPYRHFVNYGLKPVIRKEYSFDPVDVGDFYHAAMEGFAAQALKDPAFPDLSDEQISRIMDDVLSPLTAAWQDGPLNETPSMRLQGDKYRRTVHRAAWMFTHHAQHSRFKVIGEEVVFGEENGLPPVVLTLHDGRRIALRGKIDRIDRWEGDSGVYLLVSDYKSSRREIDPARLWYGLQLQLMLYLEAACEGLNGQPAGAFYFTIKDPLVDAEDVKEAAEKAIAHKLQLKGVVLADVEVTEALDSDPGYSFAKVFKKDETIAATADAYTPEQMQQLLHHAKKTAAELADRIRDGDITASPASIGDWCACQWCECASICKFDDSLPGQEKRELPDMDRQEFLTRMANDNSTSDSDTLLP